VLPSGRQHALEALLSQARRFGFTGPGPVDEQITRSLAFATVLGGPPPGPAVDLGSGGGLPGLVLAVLWPDSEWLLLDSNTRRSTWLQDAVDQLDVTGRVRVRCERAELAGRSEARYSAALVTARSFAPPGPTAECAAPLLRVGGHVLVSDPPGGSGDRWEQDGLVELGLRLESTAVVETGAGPVTISRLRSTSECSSRYPRRVGVPFKRPLF
jgi:16S rRNA (guanine527-N7)-methyltransferase